MHYLICKIAKEMSVKREALVEIAVFMALVSAGAAARVLLRDLPNFAPVAAISLFAGYFFTRWSVAACVPLAVMIISDSALGGYEWQMMLVVYGMLTLPVAARPLVRKYLAVEHGQLATGIARVAGLIGCSLIASVLFFVSTNFAWWPWTEMYSHDVTGLIECYTAGLPFFRYTLAGDLFYATLLFGGYAAAVRIGVAQRHTMPEPKVQASVN